MTGLMRDFFGSILFMLMVTLIGAIFWLSWELLFYDDTFAGIVHASGLILFAGMAIRVVNAFMEVYLND
jgi:hypothetical protein